jgi:hypothetical protein
MIVWLFLGMLCSILAIFALVWELVKVLKDALVEAKASKSWLPEQGARRATSSGYFADGADEPDGSSYAVVNGDVRLE